MKKNTNFNSRPHKEVDMGEDIVAPDDIISIHDLTRRSTISDRTGVSRFWKISIHDLTRRSTNAVELQRIILGYFNSRPHKEVDSLPRLLLLLLQHFNSRPHKEVDTLPSLTVFRFQKFQFTTSQGGRRYYVVEEHAAQHISIHDLTRRSTSWFWKR